VAEEFEGRKIYVYLPAGYETSEARYPAVYMHDGRTAFNTFSGGFGKWKTNEVMDRLMAEHQVQGMIVAAVASDDSKRGKEYVPFADPAIPSDGTTAEAFTRYFIEKVIPYIDAKYRTLAHRDQRMIMGSSFGGIQALWMGYHHPEVFSAVGVFSPSTWVANLRLFEEMKKTKEKPDIKIWIDMGQNEGMPIEGLVDILRDKGFEDGKDLFFQLDKEGRHDEASWNKRVHNPLLMFGGSPPTQVKKMEVTDYLTALGLDGSHLRINPMLAMNNGMTYTGSSLVSYKVLNPDAGRVDGMGNVCFTKPTPLQVEIGYQGLTVTHRVEYAPYMDKILGELRNAVIEEKGSRMMILLPETAEKWKIPADRITGLLRSMEPTGFYKVERMDEKVVVLNMNTAQAAQ